MKQIHPLYRSTYTGEDIVVNRTLKDGKWTHESTTLRAATTGNQYSSNSKALVIGNGESRARFDLNEVKHHKNGAISAGALQTYGCNALHRDYAPHFLVVTNDEIIDEVIGSDYTTTNIVYANLNNVSKFYTQLYRIPQDPCWDAGAMAAYMACFDGHSTVFLIGFDGIDSQDHSYNMYQGTSGYPELENGYSEEFWVRTMGRVFAAYPEVDFVRVMPTSSYRIPAEWKWASNFRQIDFNQFVNEVDL